MKQDNRIYQYKAAGLDISAREMFPEKYPVDGALVKKVSPSRLRCIGLYCGKDNQFCSVEDVSSRKLIGTVRVASLVPAPQALVEGSLVHRRPTGFRRQRGGNRNG